ncbi:hypothetical protein [Pseudomonas oryzae]|uniref:hypothetical protein n=1 Tax=Pseudomonas oryzae TaxID=1392877 RepID=UPI0012FE44B4|nr:hypothetical protein [Pseudomonas oryzae]
MASGITADAVACMAAAQAAHADGRIMNIVTNLQNAFSALCLALFTKRNRPSPVAGVYPLAPAGHLPRSLPGSFCQPPMSPMLGAGFFPDLPACDLHLPFPATAGLALSHRHRARVKNMNLLINSRARYYAYYRTSPRR